MKSGPRRSKRSRGSLSCGGRPAFRKRFSRSWRRTNASRVFPPRSWRRGSTMSDAVQDLIAALHDSPCKYAAALTGGGSGLAGRLLSVPGGSRTVLEIVVPYSEDALSDYLGVRLDSFCSAD